MTLDDIFNEPMNQGTAKPVSSSSLTVDDIFGEDIKIPEQGNESRNDYYKKLQSQGIDTASIENARKEKVKNIAKAEGGFGDIVSGAVKTAGQAVVGLGQIVNFFTAPVTDLFTGSSANPKQFTTATPFSKKIENRLTQAQESKILQPSNPIQEATMIASMTEAPFLRTKNSIVKEGVNRGLQETKTGIQSLSEAKPIAKNAQLTDKAINDIASTIIGKETKGKSTRTDEGVIPSNVNTKEAISNVIKDFSDQEAATIAKSQDAAQDFANIVNEKSSAINRKYYEFINEADKRGMYLDGDVIAAQKQASLLQNKEFAKLKKAIDEGLQDGTISFDTKASKFVTDDYAKSLKVNEYNPIYANIVETKGKKIPFKDAQNTVDIANVKYKANYANKEKRMSIETDSYKTEADITRGLIRQNLDSVTNNMFNQFADKRANYQDIASKFDKRLNASVVEKMQIDSKTPFEIAKEQIGNLDVENLIRFKPFNVAKKAFQNVLGGKYTSKVDDALRRAFNKYHESVTGRPVPQLDEVAFSNLNKMRQKEYMDEFIQELYKFQDTTFLPPPSVIISPQFTESTIQAMRDIHLTPSEIVNDKVNYQAFINELYRQPKMKLLIEQNATPASKMQGTTANPIITPAPTAYEKPATKIGTTDTSKVEPKKDNVVGDTEKALVEEAKKYDNVDDFIKNIKDTNKNPFEFHWSYSDKLENNKTFKDQKTEQKEVGGRSLGNGIYTTKDLFAWYSILKKELGDKAPKNLYIVETKNPNMKNTFSSTNGLKNAVEKGQKVTKPEDVKVIKRIDLDGLNINNEKDIYPIMDKIHQEYTKQLEDIYNQAKKTK